jgi:hypothetical protein
MDLRRFVRVLRSVFEEAAGRWFNVCEPGTPCLSFNLQVRPLRTRNASFIGPRRLLIDHQTMSGPSKPPEALKMPISTTAPSTISPTSSTPPTDAFRAERAELFLRTSTGKAEVPVRRKSSGGLDPAAPKVSTPPQVEGMKGFFMLGELARRLSASGASGPPTATPPGQGK